jgi:arylsulfatase A-like enzyme
MTALIAISIWSAACRAPHHSNVVLIVIDTLRADHLPVYGYDKDTAPFLTEWASQAVVFERTYATSSWTAPSTASILTSLHPIQHGVLTGFHATRTLQKGNPMLQLNRIPDGVETIAETLKAAGYSTWAVTDNINISKELGFDQGFDTFLNLDYQGARIVNQRLRNWEVRLKQSTPYFLYVHYMDPHKPYNRRTPWFQEGADEMGNRIRAYDSEIRFLDERLRAAFERFGWRDDALVVITSDHGEEFGEHGGSEHGRTLYSEVIRVPLIIQGPQETRLPPRRVETAVSLLDILPTIRASVGLSPSPQARGQNLLPLLYRRAPGSSLQRSIYAHLRSPPWYGEQTTKALIQDRWKYILTLPDLEELYDLAADPYETTSAVGSAPEQAARMKSTLKEMEDSILRYQSEEISVPLTDDLQERLRALGYLQ